MRLIWQASLVILSSFSLLKIASGDTSKYNHGLREALLMVLSPGRKKKDILSHLEDLYQHLALT